MSASLILPTVALRAKLSLCKSFELFYNHDAKNVPQRLAHEHHTIFWMSYHQSHKNVIYWVEIEREQVQGRKT
jgi:hypothetical protein